MRVFYFGVWSPNQLGHYLYEPSGRMAGREAERALPFKMHILDTGLLPDIGPCTEGFIHRSVINGWTVLTFWDRSGDSRGNSNSSFIIEGDHQAEAALAIAKAAFPSIFSRFTFVLIIDAPLKQPPKDPKQDSKAVDKAVDAVIRAMLDS